MHCASSMYNIFDFLLSFSYWLCSHYILTMLKSRNRRIHTDYSNHSTSFHSKQIPFQSRRKSTIGLERQSYITRTLNSINHVVNYDKLSLEQIEAQRQLLKLKVKDMNSIINNLIAAQIQTRYDESRVSKKTTINHEMGIDVPSLSHQTHVNSTKIVQLQGELEQNLTRLASLNNLQAKVEYGRRVGETEVRIKQLRQQLGRIKKNKLLREKQIMKGNVKQNEQMHHLQQEYIAINKKAESIATRIKIIQQQLADSDFSLDRQKDDYDQVRAEYLQIEDNFQRQRQEQQELFQAYQAKKRKFDILTNKNSKQIEAKKKKYYNLLLQYQEYNSRDEITNQKTAVAITKNQNTLIILSKLLEHIKGLDETRPTAKSTHNYHPDADIFQLTDPNQQFREKHDIKVNFSSNKLPVQNQLNKANVKNRICVRKWKLQGSIVHQKITPSNGRLMNSLHRAESEEQLENSSIRKSGTSKASRQIRNFKTQMSPNLSFVKTEMEEYQDDFQS